MVVIRPEQMAAFQAQARGSFETEMAAHLAEVSPPLANGIGDRQLRQVIRLGIERAGVYGFDCRGPVRLYLELMLLFGSHFDSDPQYPWAAELLAGDQRTAQMQRALWLFEQARDYQQRVAGPEDAWRRAGLENLAALIRLPSTIAEATLAAELQGLMAQAYPQKAVAVGDEALQALIQQGRNVAQWQGFDTMHEVVVIVMLLFAFGHGCDTDPLYPWIAQALQDDPVAEPPARAERLAATALTWFDRLAGAPGLETQR